MAIDNVGDQGKSLSPALRKFHDCYRRLGDTRQYTFKKTQLIPRHTAMLLAILLAEMNDPVKFVARTLNSLLDLTLTEEEFGRLLSLPEEKIDQNVALIFDEVKPRAKRQR